MAYTNFLRPRTFTQNTAQAEKSWSGSVDGVGTVGPLSSFETTATGLVIYSGWSLGVPATSDGSTDTVINGIECKIISNKDARIVDSVIQLAQNGSVIGSNKASVSTGEVHTYGGSTDLWGTSLTFNDLSTLQVALKYKSGGIPHRDTCYVYSVRLKIHYT
jgi:hypothetical protein